MSEDKICPFMSRPAQNHVTVTPYDPSIEYYAGTLLEVCCQKERCEAWGKKHVIDYDNYDVDSSCIIVEGCRLIS